MQEVNIQKDLTCETFSKEEFPSINDGVRGMDFIEKTIESNSKGNVWIELNN